MKNLFMAGLVAGLLPLLASCAGRGPLVIGPVGPETSRQIEATPTGYLKVYSATEDHKDGNMHYFPHTSYSICTEDGKILRKVANAIGVHDEDPALVELPAGTYTALAGSRHYGRVKVTVVIEPGKLTTVNLEDDKLLPRGPSKSVHDLVRLPNGSVVGWRAERSPQVSATEPAQL